MAETRVGHRSLRAAGLAGETATDLARRALADHPGIAVQDLGPGRLGVTRTRRPRWALVACVATVWLAGLGLLFLLVRHTEAGEVVVHDGPFGAVVTIPPMLAGAPAEALTSALQYGSTAAPAAWAAAPAGPAVADDLEGRTVARTDLPAAPEVPVAAPPTAPATAVLRFDAGTIPLEAGARLVLGRDPAADGPAPGRVVPGDASTVSKSHLLVAFDGASITALDLGSTNGSSLVRGGRGDAPRRRRRDRPARRRSRHGRCRGLCGRGGRRVIP